MKSVLIVFFVISLLLLILVHPFKIRFMLHFNLFDFKGFYSVKIFGIRLLTGMVYRKDGKIVVQNSADIFSGNMSKPFVKHFISELIKRLNINKVEIFFVGGVKNNSFSSAMICGGVSSLVQTLYSVLSQKYDKVRLYHDVSASYAKDKLELTFDIVTSISLLSIIISIIRANFANNKVKEANNEG